MDNKHNQTTLKFYNPVDSHATFFHRELKPTTFEGKWFIKTVAGSETSNQDFIGIDALAKKVKPISTICHTFF